MFKYLIKSFILIVLMTFEMLPCSAQSTIKSDNIAYIDSLERELKVHFCSDILSYTENYAKNKLMLDKSIMSIANEIFLDDLSLGKLDTRIKKIKAINFKKEIKQNGLINIVHFIFKGNYIKIDLKLETIDTNIYRKHFSISSVSNGKCGGASFRLFDFNLFKNHLLGCINFKIAFQGNQIIANSFNESRLLLSSKKYTDYKFNIPNSSDDELVNRIFLMQYNIDSLCFYSYLTPPSDYLLLIKNNKTDVLKNLLFSPNYFYAVNAMESLLYLKSIGKIEIDNEIIKRIDYLKNADYLITIKKTNDLFMVVSGYKDIKITEDDVIRKYGNHILNK